MSERKTWIIHVHDGRCDGVLRDRTDPLPWPGVFSLQAAEIIIGVENLNGRMADLGLNLLSPSGEWITWWRRDAYRDPAGVQDIADWKLILPPVTLETGIRMQWYGTQVGQITEPKLAYGMDLLLHGTLTDTNA